MMEHGRKQGNGGTRGLEGIHSYHFLSRSGQPGGSFIGTVGILPHCTVMRHLTFHVTDLNAKATRMNQVALDESEIATFTRRLAHDLAQNVPEVRNQGACVILYDEEGNRLSITPIDTVQ